MGTIIDEIASTIESHLGIGKYGHEGVIYEYKTGINGPNHVIYYDPARYRYYLVNRDAWTYKLTPGFLTLRQACQHLKGTKKISIKTKVHVWIRNGRCSTEIPIAWFEHFGNVVCSILVSSRLSRILTLFS